jgi:hypothetical protein
MEESGDKTLLSAYFKKPLDVVRTLMQLPQVTRVERVPDGEKENIRVTIGVKPKTKSEGKAAQQNQQSSIPHVTPLEIPLTWHE